MSFRILSIVITLCVMLGPGSLFAAVHVEINGLSEELRQNVEAFLELKQRGKDDTLSDTSVRRLFAKADENIRQALRPFGYYEPHISSHLSQTENGWLASFDIDQGRPALIHKIDVQISGEGQSDPGFIALVNESGIVMGEPVRHDHYDAFKARLAELAAERGYFEAHFTRHELIVDQAHHIASVHLQLDTGPRYRVGAISIEQDFLADRVVERAIDIEQGDYFDSTRLRDIERALFDMRYFSLVDIDIRPNAEIKEVPLTIWLAPTRRNRWTVGGGYSTDTNIYLRAGWENRIVNRAGHRTSLHLRLSEPKQDLLHRYVIPYRKPSQYLTIATGVIRELRGDTVSQRLEIAPIDTRPWGAWQRNLYGIIQAEYSEIAEISFDDIFIIPGIQLIRTQWNQDSRPTKGYKLTVGSRGSSTAIGSTTDYVQVNVRSANYVPIKPRFRLYLRGEVGITAVEDFNQLPASQRFFAGGDRSVRGWGLNELSPVDANGDKIGGQHLLFGSIEFEFDIRKAWTIDTFIDVGNAFDSFSDPLEYSAGVGARWRSPLGLIGLDIAQPLSDDDRGPRLHLSIRPDL